MNLKILEKKQKQIEKAYLEFLKKRDKILGQTRSASFLYPKFKKTHSAFCPLYITNKVCHKVEKKSFDCWNCYCNYYDYKHIDKRKRLLGRCKKLRNKGKYTNGIWDCSDCFDVHKF